MTLRRNLRAALATIVVAGAVLGVGQVATQAADSCSPGEPCVQITVHNDATSGTTVTYVTPSEFRPDFTAPEGTSYSTRSSPSQAPINQASTGATIPSLLPKELDRTKIYNVVVTGSRDPSPTNLRGDALDGSQYDAGLPPIVTLDGGFGFIRPLLDPSIDPNDVNSPDFIPPDAGGILKIDVYTRGRQLDVKLTGPRGVVKKGQQVTFSTSVADVNPSAPLTYTYDFGNGKPVKGGTSIETSYRGKSQGILTAVVTVSGPDDSSGRAETKVNVGTTIKPGSGDQPGSGGNGNGTGTSKSPNTLQSGPNNSSGTTLGGVPSNTPQSGVIPTDPFQVPRGVEGPLTSELLGSGTVTAGEQVSGLVLTGADGEGPLSDRDPSRQVDEATAPAAGIGGKASPLGIILLVAGILLVLVASAASELAGLKPTARKTTARQRRGAP